MTGMIGVARARDDENVGPHCAYVFNDIIDDARGVDGDDDSGRRGKPASFEKTRIGGVAIVNIKTLAAVTSHRQGVGIGGDVGDAVLPQQRTYNLADTAIADHDRMLLPAGRAGGQFGIDGFARREPGRERPRGNGKKRRQRHGHRGHSEREAR